MKTIFYLMIFVALSTLSKAETIISAPKDKYSERSSLGQLSGFCKEAHCKKTHYFREIEKVERKPVLELGTENIKFSINKDVHVRNGEIENTKLQFSSELRFGDFSVVVSLSSERLDVFISC
jgi:hypothetical protein